MSRYIDAKKLIEALREKCDGCKDKWTDYCTTCCDVEQLIEMIDNADDEDVVERKKGKWIRSGEGCYEVYECSSCGKLWMEWWASVGDSDWMSKKLKYCPNCGADMREEKTDAEIH